MHLKNYVFYNFFKKLSSLKINKKKILKFYLLIFFFSIFDNVFEKFVWFPIKQVPTTVYSQVKFILRFLKIKKKTLKKVKSE